MKSIILCYHKIGTEADEGRWLNCDPKTLESHCKFFERRGCPGFLPRDFLSHRPEGVCFTFDDAYVSAVENAPTVLEAFGYRGAFYAVSSLVGKSSEWDSERARPLATWAELLALENRGHEIGNHTWSHPRLDQLTFDDQVKELESSQSELARNGLNITSACFPYGAHNEQTLEAMKQVGLGVGLKLGKRPVENDDPRALSRVIASFSDSLPLLLYKIYIRPKLP